MEGDFIIGVRFDEMLGIRGAPSVVAQFPHGIEEVLLVEEGLCVAFLLVALQQVGGLLVAGYGFNVDRYAGFVVGHLTDEVVDGKMVDLDLMLLHEYLGLPLESIVAPYECHDRKQYQ